MLFSDPIELDIIKAAEPFFNGPAALLFYQGVHQGGVGTVEIEIQIAIGIGIGIEKK